MPPAKDRTIRGAALGLGSMALAVLLLALAWPRLRASIEYLPVETALGNYYSSGAIPTAQLEGLAQRARDALALHDHYRYWNGLSLLTYLRALDAATPAWLRGPALHQSLDAAEEAIQRAPARPQIWLRIATVRAHLGQAPERVIPPLKMSILTGRVEPTLLLPRLRLAYAYLPLLDLETRRLLRDQTLLAWRVDQREFVRDLGEGAIDFARVRQLLEQSDRALLKEMEAQLAAAA